MPMGMTDGWSRPHERGPFGLHIRDVCPACQERDLKASVKKAMDDAWAKVQQTISEEELRSVGKSLTEIMQMRLDRP